MICFVLYVVVSLSTPVIHCQYLCLTGICVFLTQCIRENFKMPTCKCEGVRSSKYFKRYMCKDCAHSQTVERDGTEDRRASQACRKEGATRERRQHEQKHREAMWHMLSLQQLRVRTQDMVMQKVHLRKHPKD